MVNMKPVSLASAVLTLVSGVIATAASKQTLSGQFKPPQVFKNANLVHIISLEKNYVKEQLNVVVENVSKEPQSEYYLPFTSEQLARVGGFEVKDRKDGSVGNFISEPAEYDPKRFVELSKLQRPPLPPLFLSSS